MLRWFKTLMGTPGTPPDAPETAAPTLLVGLPFEMIAVPGHEAVQAWEKLRGRPGQTPIILGGHEDVQPMVESFESDTKSAQQVLADAAQIDPKRWLREQYDADPHHPLLLLGGIEAERARLFRRRRLSADPRRARCRPGQLDLVPRG